MRYERKMAMTTDDLRLMQEAVSLLLVVKRAARATRDEELVEALGEKLFGKEEEHGQSEISGGV